MTGTTKPKVYLIEGIALLSLILLVVFALRGTIVGQAVYTNRPCHEGATMMSCAADGDGTYLIEMSCEHGKWRELSTKCDCAMGEKGAYCAG